MWSCCGQVHENDLAGEVGGAACVREHDMPFVLGITGWTGRTFGGNRWASSRVAVLDGDGYCVYSAGEGGHGQAEQRTSPSRWASGSAMMRKLSRVRPEPVTLLQGESA